uniref:TGF_BETA_2 domain-containing protein n=1 Tax=Schistosoma mansoni TaxID=6183 RepID=A0A5K4F662_SCHMA
MKQLKYCFIFNPSSILLKNKIHLATISTYIHSWINPNQLKLHVFLMNSKNEIYEHFYINLYNKTIQNDLKYSNIKLKYRQVIWDISSMIKNLQYSKYHLIHSIIMTLVTNNHDDQSNNNVDDIHLNYIDLSNQLLSKPSSTSTTTIEDEPMENQDELKQILPNKHFNEDNDNDLEFTNNDNNNFNEKLNEQFESLFRKKNLLKINKNNKNNNHHNHNIIDNILSYNTQIILNMKTLNILQLENQYLIKKRLIHRSFLIESNKLINHYNIQSCPSFLDHNKRETKCCLFRYTLNKMQMDQNDKLRFIIFPHHLPINMCHGRCIGLYMPTDNAHSILMNRYFSGLGSVEREAIYNSMPCCAANETIPFTILYKDHKDQLVTETLPKAVKTNCACS